MEPYNIKFPDYKHKHGPKPGLKPIPETIDFEAMPAHTPKVDPDKRLKNMIGRELVAILRHRAVNAGLPIGEDGYVPVKALLSHNSKLKRANLKMIEEIVAENDKKRLELAIDPVTKEPIIRAVQGHTIRQLDEDKIMERIFDAKQLAGTTVVHGTTDEAWGFIRKTGLNRMARNHIHFAKGYPGDKDVISGMRKSCTIYVELDVPLALNNGIKLMESSNGVILSSGQGGVISPLYFKHVFQVDPKTGDKVRIFGNDDLLKLKSEFLYRYLFIMDLEANCLDGQLIDPQEILEFPVVVLDTHTNEILKDKTFHYYVKPDVHPVSQFCTDLTGITQQMVDKGLPLADVLAKFDAWVAQNGFNLDDCCFLTCGLWDLKTCLKNEAVFRKIELNPFFKRFINLKEVFALKCNFKESKFGMVDMLVELELDQQGRHHSGIDDSFNIARIAQHLNANNQFISRDFTRFAV